jgi:hypothetical protein
MGTPVLGVHGGAYPAKGTWSLSFGWRYQKSDKHFVGDEYQEQRTEEGSQVINHVNLADATVRYQASKRIELSLGAPYFMGTRSQSVRNTNTNVLVERFQTQARGMGDVFFAARRWMLDPDKHTKGNVQLGLGVKLPTGQTNVNDNFRVFSATPAPNGTITTQVRTVDQSIQPGDGGFGILADINTFRSLGSGNFALYFNAAYLSNPQETSEVLTYRSSTTLPGEEKMSIADQYLVRGGVTAMVPGAKNLSFSAGVRWEGVPVHDLIGGSDWFRRPGYAVSIEPALSYVKGSNVFTVGVPFAVYRNRLQSVPDAEHNRHGDAAFADYLIMVGFTHSF